MQKQTRKAARPCKSSRAQFITLKLRIPKAAVPLLTACSATNEQTPEAYAVTALASILRCDAEGLASAANDTFAEMEGGAQ